MNPTLMAGEYIFCTAPDDLAQFTHLNPVASFVEREGVTLILPKMSADLHNISYDTIYKQITLTVHSSLNAVGLTAAVSGKLASKGISANVMAAYFHDHIFIQKEKAEKALAALREIPTDELRK